MRGEGHLAQLEDLLRSLDRIECVTPPFQNVALSAPELGQPARASVPWLNSCSATSLGSPLIRSSIRCQKCVTCSAGKFVFPLRSEPASVLGFARQATILNVCITSTP